ncbi:NAD-dependent epimerase/dehydratase family protein [Streptomyces sp. So13.3]|uniref:condensation domain-containing protein n=1 Tax=Streptomyces TaxID=1883 RepID=UPI001105A3A8|nr:MULTISPECIES: condensation domain-containing protein [Streptomyces]MCZ4102336.1 condensation domain-containing protein [Streptomyces sp. H39-C1]QNA71644.1 NAD-dependent epimerase/dehydratase family protein [Streptomyces sp. So13.3]
MATDTHPSSAALQEELLRRARARKNARPADPAPATTRDQGPTPLSHAQRRMWLMDRLGQGGSLYSVPFATRLRGPLDLAALGSALTTLVQRHDILRTRYGQHGDEPYQETLPVPDAIVVPVIDAVGDGLAALTEEARRPFDLAAGPLPRALALRHGPQDHTVLLTFHHISIDGGSLETVAAELAELYAAATGGIPCELTRPPQYADFAVREHAAAGRLDEGLAHWTRRLSGAVPLRLPRPARPAADLTERPAAVRNVPLDERVLPALRELGLGHRATLFTVAFTAAFAALHRFTGEDDLVIGCAGTHREGSAMRGLVGLCVNTLPIRVDLSGDPEFGTLVDRVRDALLEAQQYRDVPFDLVLERLGAAARDADGTPLVRVTADVLGEPTALRLPGLAAEPVDVALGEAKFDLSFGLSDTDRPTGLVQYGRAALGDAAGERLADDFAGLLAAVAADPELRLSRLPGRPPVLPAAETPPTDGHPAEVLLRAHPLVADAAVPDPAGGPLLAYAVLRGTGGPSPVELRSYLRAGLGRELVPAAVTLLDAMPRTADGTLDTARLPGAPAAPVPSGVRAEAVTVAFTALLGRAPGPDDDFFVLGGHSLIAVQLAERLRTGLKLPLTGLDVMEHRTPRAIAALLDARETERERLAAATGAPAARARRTREGTVLVTGGTGGVGAFVLRELAARGRPVLALSRPESAHLVAGEGVEVVEGDLTDLDGLRAAVGRADAVIHAACTFTRPEVDVAAMAAMVGAWNRGPFVFVSSVDAYGRPTGPRVAEESAPAQPLSAYGQAKLDCEQLLMRAAGTDGRGGASVVRSPIVWGPHDRLRDQLRWGATGLLYQAALAGEPIDLPRPGTAGHDWYGAPWVHAAALARAVTDCLATPVHGVANAVSGHVGWPELAAELKRLLGSDSEIRLVDRVHPDLDHRWHYGSGRLATALDERPGEDRSSVLAAMTGSAGR